MRQSKLLLFPCAGKHHEPSTICRVIMYVRTYSHSFPIRAISQARTFTFHWKKKNTVEKFLEIISR